MGNIILFVIVGAFIAIRLYKKAIDAKWKAGIFPKRTHFDRSNLMEAYICLGTRLIHADREDSAEKIRYMNNYLSEHFFEYDYGEFISSLRFSSKYPIKVNTVAAWLKMHLHQKAQRLQVMYFLAGLSVVDGDMNHRELRILRELNDLLGLSVKDFESILSMYRQQEERKQEQRQSHSSKTRSISLAFQVLGVSEKASWDEIKKAYRRLVKLHHPDRFATESTVQQELAKERFVEIQKAYEVIEKHKIQ